MTKQVIETIIKALDNEFESELEFQYSQPTKDYTWLNDYLAALKEMYKKLYRNNTLLVLGSINEYLNKIKELKGE